VGGAIAAVGEMKTSAKPKKATPLRVRFKFPDGSHEDISIGELEAAKLREVEWLLSRPEQGLRARSKGTTSR
jgi:hypothetical protein